MNFKFILTLILLLAMVGTVCAEYQAPMNSSDSTYINKTYTMSDSSSTPFSIWIFVAAAGFYLLLISFLATSEQNSDIFGILSVPVLALATWQSLMLDVITGSGVTSQAGKYVLLESHTLYSITAVTILFVIIFIVSILNLYRLFIMNKGSEDEY